MCNYTHIGDNPIVVGKLDEVDDEVSKNVVENIKCASLVIETMKFVAKEEVKRHLEHMCIHWNTKEEGCHWWIVKWKPRVCFPLKRSTT